MLGFADYDTPACSGVMQAIARLEEKWRPGIYGNDSLSKTARDAIRDLFGLSQDAGVFFVPNGSAANRLAMATILPHSFDAIIAMDSAHINVHEAGSAESLAHKVLPIRSASRKITVGDLSACWETRSDIHRARPEAVSISQATEFGEVYSWADFKSINAYALPNCIRCHLDGARLANAAAYLKTCDLRSLTFDGAVDVLTFGFAKNGGLYGDIVVIPHPGLAEIAERYHKQFGYLAPRMQLQAVQVLAMLKDNLWYRNALHANESALFLAKEIREQFSIDPLYLVQTNAVFVSMPKYVADAVTNEGCGCIWHDDNVRAEDYEVVRFVTAWNTTEVDIYELVAFLKSKWP